MIAFRDTIVVACLVLVAAPCSADAAQAAAALPRKRAAQTEPLDVEATLSKAEAYLVAQDYTQAAAWYRKGADQGHADAQFLLGVSYSHGQGVTQDYAQAAAWYLRAADQGRADAKRNLGLLYTTGRGVLQDYAQAVAWFRKGADEGDAGSMFSLGGMYSTGKGVPQDYVEGHKWRNLAAARADAKDQKEYADTRDALAKEMTPQQIAEAQKRASEWLAAFEKRAK